MSNSLRAREEVHNSPLLRATMRSTDSSLIHDKTPYAPIRNSQNVPVCALFLDGNSEVPVNSVLLHAGLRRVLAGMSITGRIVQDRQESSRMTTLSPSDGLRRNTEQGHLESPFATRIDKNTTSGLGVPVNSSSLPCRESPVLDHFAKNRQNRQERPESSLSTTSEKATGSTDS